MEEAQGHGIDPVGIIQPKHRWKYEPAPSESAENLPHFPEESVYCILLLLLDCLTNSGRGIAGGDYSSN